jgi:hypothetical protein
LTPSPDFSANQIFIEKRRRQTKKQQTQEARQNDTKTNLKLHKQVNNEDVTLSSAAISHPSLSIAAYESSNAIRILSSPEGNAVYS